MGPTGEWDLYCDIVICALILISIACVLEYLIRVPAERRIGARNWKSILVALVVAGIVIWANTRHTAVFLGQHFWQNYPVADYATGWPLTIVTYCQITAGDHFYPIDDASLAGIAIDYVVGVLLVICGAAIWERLTRFRASRSK